MKHEDCLQILDELLELENDELNTWEAKFVSDLDRSRSRSFSDKQQQCLLKIYRGLSL